MKLIKTIRIIAVILVLLSVGIMVSWWMFTTGYGGKYHMGIHLSLVVAEFVLGFTQLVLVSIRDKEQKKQNEKNNQNENKE